MAVNFNPPLTDVLKTGEPVEKGQVSALFGVLRDAVNADLDPRATPIYASRDAAIAAAPLLPTSLLHIMVREGTALVVRSRTAFADDPLFDTGARWGVVQRHDPSLVASHLLARLEIQGGTADAIVAAVPPGMPSLSTGSYYLLVPTATNTASQPTLTIAGVTRRLETETGATLAAGRLVPNTPHLIKIHSNGAARIVGLFVLPDELPSIRNSVTSISGQIDALSTEITRLGAVRAVEYVLQTGASVPARPSASVVFWLTWSDPTSLMGPADIWFRMPEPTVPDLPAEGSWRWSNARNGTAAVLQILSVPDESPPLTGIHYRVDGGAWVSVPPLTGDIVIDGFVEGQEPSLSIRHVNFVGDGIPAPARSVRVDTNSFNDNFDRASQPLSNDVRWVDVLLGNRNRKLMVAGGLVRAADTNETYVAQVQEYFPPDQMAAVRVLSAGTNTSTDRGVSLFVRMTPGEVSGYRLRVAAGTWSLARVVKGTVTALGFGSHGGTFPMDVRLSAVGNVITATMGTRVETVTDSGPAALTGGTVGLGVNASGTDGVDAVRADDFMAGRA